MGVNLENLPALGNWVNVTEAAEIIGISRQYAYRMAARTNDGLEGGWQTIHRIGTKGNYLISLNEVHERKRIKEAGGNVAGEIDIAEDEPEIFTPSPRLIYAYSWWLAAELVRRNPHFVIRETHPGGGMYDCLSIRDRRHGVGQYGQDAPTLVDLNRAGSIHTFREDPDGTVHDQTFTWLELLSLEHPSRLVDAIEEIAVLDNGEQHPPTPTSLAYLLLAEILMSKVTDDAIWDIRNEINDWDPFDDSLSGFIQEFPSIIDQPYESQTRSERASQMESPRRFWAVLRNQDAVLIVSSEGTVHTRQRSLHLSELTIDLAGGIRALAARLLAQADHERFEDAELIGSRT